MSPHGLGNKLFPWARCRIFSHVHGIPMLAPAWFQIPKGLFVPIFEKKYYFKTFFHNLFKRDGRNGDIKGLKKLWLNCTAEVKEEPEKLFAFVRENSRRDQIVTFRREPQTWPQNRFLPLNGWDEFLHQELRTITQGRWLRIVDSFEEVPIGIPVRFEMQIGGSLDWFIESLKAIRTILGFPAQAIVTTDGSKKDVRALLAMENIQFPHASAIAELLVLSKAKVLLASGHSSFSTWASFLGQMPTICNPTTTYRGLYFHEGFGLENRKGQYLGPFDPNSPLPVFVKQLKELFRNYLNLPRKKFLSVI